MNVEQVVREVQVRGSVQGMDRVASAYDSVALSSDKASVSLGKSGNSAAIAEAAVNKLGTQLQDNYRQQQQFNQMMVQAAAANDNYANKSSHLSDVLRVGTKAAIDHAASWLATAGAIGAGALVLGGLLAILGPIILAYKLLKDVIGLVAEAWRLGGDELERYRKVAEDAAKVDLSTTYFQKITKGAEDAKVPVEALTAALTNLQKASADQLGGSALQKRLDDSVKAGNFAGNSGVQQYAQANTTEQRYEAIVSLINQAMTAGQRLAALDIANTAFGAQVVDNLRKDSEYLDKISAAAAKVSDTKLVSDEDVGRALDLKNRYDAAVAILETRWHPIQGLLTAAGIEFHANWVAIVETIAKGVDWVTKLVAKLGDAPSWFQKKLNEGGQWIIDNTTTPESRKAAEQQYGISSDPAEMAKGTDDYASAVNKLRAGLQNQAEMQRKVAEANTIAQKTLGDTSHAIEQATKAAVEHKDALDRAMDSVEKYIQITEAAAKSVGAGVYEQQKAKVIAELTAAALRDGKTNLQQYAAEWDVLGNRAGAAAQKLALAQAQSQADFTRQTLFMSRDDIAAANVMKNIYGPEWQSHMDDALAKQIKMNAQLQEAKDSAQQFASTFVQGLLQGKSGMDALVASADQLASKLADKGIEDLFSGNFVEGAVKLGASALISVFTGDQKAKKQLAEAQSQWKAAGPAFETFLRQMSGGAVGDMVASLQATWQQVQDFAEKAAKAHDNGAITQAYQAYTDDLVRTVQSFQRSFGGMLDAINEGLGPNSPFATGANNIRQVGETLKKFIDDARLAFDSNPLGLATGQSSAAGAEAQVAAATAAAEKYLLTLLGQPPALSATATAIQTMQGAAVQLRATLGELGMSSTAAAAAIDDGVRKAMQDLADTFSAGLTERLNTANGKSYLNDTVALLKQHQQDIADAASLGLDQAAVAAVFHAEAQKIVDDAGLIGDSFAGFITQFPELAGVVDQSSAAMQDAADAIQKSAEELSTFLKSVTRTISDYLQSLKTGASSTLSPQAQLAAAQSNFSAQLALAQGGNRDALTGITQVAQTLLDQAKSFYASSQGYASIYDQVTAALQGLTGINPGTVASADTQAIVAAVNATTGAVNTTGASNDNLTAAQNALAAQQTTYLQTQVSLLGAINSLADRFVAAINQLGSLTASIGSIHADQFQQMIGQLLSIAKSSGSPSGGSVWTWLGLQNGGVVPGYAAGGIVGNGIPGIDSVLARYAGGGTIALAGQEGILTRDATSAIGGAATVDYINRNLRLPQVASMAALRAPNDNGRAPDGAHFAALARTNAAGFSAVVAAVRDLEAVVHGSARTQADAIRQKPAERPGRKSAGR